MRTILCSTLLVLCILCTGCSGTHPIVGQWQSESSPNEIWEYYKDGTLRVYDKNDATKYSMWTYAVLDDTSLKLSPDFGKAYVAKFRIEGNTLYTTSWKEFRFHRL